MKNLQTSLNQPETITVLAVSPNREDHAALRRIFHHPTWRIESAYGLSEAVRILESEHPTIVVCERELPDGDWKDVFWHVCSQGEHPPLIVTSRHADDQLWAEVLNLGGYDVLLKPFETSEVLSVMGMAWRQARAASRKSAALAPVA